MRRFGIDVGGVITDRVNDGTDTSFLSDNFLATTRVAGCFEAIARIVGALAPENVFVVSKCGKRVQEKAQAWLAHHRFYELTNFREENIRFCLTRSEKAPICRDLCITDFVDDRIDVPRFMDGVVERRYLFAPAPSAHLPNDLIAVSGWKGLLVKAGI
jgi:hypothetical protein